MSSPILIAEVKTKSPFGFKSYKSWADLFAIANKHGDWISIHTDPRWGGSFHLVEKARQMTNKPILAKGIHQSDIEVDKALNMGADYVLVVGRIPNKNLNKCLVEVNSIEQLKSLSPSVKAVWNARDLSTGEPKKETFEQARKVFSGWLCQASLIQTKQDAYSKADAILVGQNLEQFIESLVSPKQ